MKAIARTALLLCPVLCLPFSAGCSGRPAMEARASDVERVPVPVVAEAHRTIPNAFTVPGMTFDELSKWYDARLPFEASWEQWAWCDGNRYPGGSRTSRTDHRVYHKRGSSQMLAVTLIEERNGPVVILIGTDESGPCS